MLYSSKLVNQTQEKQIAADVTLAGFSDGVRQAIALAEHFEKITPEEYVVPAGWSVDETADGGNVASESNLWASGYSRL